MKISFSQIIKTNKVKLINSLLSLLPTIVRFFLTLFIAQQFSIFAFGKYSLLNTILNISIVFISFEFYLYTTKSIVQNKENYIQYLGNQIIFNIVLTFLVSPLIFYLVYEYADIEEYWLYIVVLFVIISEQISRAVNRTLFAFNKSSLGYFLGLIKSGIWPAGILLLIYFNVITTYKNLIEFILVFWTSGNLLHVIISIPFLRRLTDKSTYDFKLDLNYIRKGLAESFPIFINAFIIQLVLNISKFLIEKYSTTIDVGVFSFYYQLSNVFNIIVTSAILTVAYPKILTHISNNEEAKYTKISDKMSKDIVVFTGLALVFSLIFLKPFLNIMEKKEFIDGAYGFYFVIIGIALMLYSNKMLYVMFAREKSKEIVVSAILIIITTVFVTWLMVVSFGLAGAYISVAISGIIILVIRSFFFSDKWSKEGK